MSTAPEIAVRETRPAPRVPPLQAGDRLTAQEFLRRYAAMPAVGRAELVEGVVYMPPPVSAIGHSEPQFNLNGWLFFYCLHTPTVRGGDNATLRLDPDNTPQPDGYLRLLPECGGRSRVGEDGFLHGPPELIAEIAASSASYDLHDKLNAYRRNGVQEYIVWRVWDRRLDWFVLREGRYEPLPAGGDGIFRSEVFPGLWLDAEALLRGDLASAAAVWQAGLASPEHAAFLRRTAGAS